MAAFILKESASMRCAYEEAKRYLFTCGIEDAAVDAWYLMELVTGITRAGFLADRERSLSEEHRVKYVSLVNQRGAHIPLQHLTGEQEFMGLPFLVNEHVLIPRQDTETLVELALSVLERELAEDDDRAGTGRVCSSGRHPWHKGREGSGRFVEAGGTVGEGIGSDAERNKKGTRPYRILDLCTGSGCIAISLWKQWEARSRRTESIERIPCLEIIASDLSGEALTIACENARRLGAAVHFVQSDLFVQLSVSGSGKFFDMIVSNPPYIRTSVIEELSDEVRLHEPRMALDGGTDGLDFYRKIICESRGYLRTGGWLLLEIGYDQGEAVSDLMCENGFIEVRVTKDLPGNDRVVSGRLSRMN